MLLCTATIVRHVTLNNVVSILAEATYYNALCLVDILQDYVACNLEAIVESRFIDDMHPDLIKSLSVFVRSRQAKKSPIVRSNLIAETALRKASSWLELQDIPQPLVRSPWHAKDSPKLNPVSSDQSIFPRRTSLPGVSPLSSPALDATARQSPPRTPKPNQGDDIFVMDVPVDTIPTLHIGQAESPGNYVVPVQAWKSKPSYGSSR
jgi:inhibitor of Bruton tyrosine kinase